MFPSVIQLRALLQSVIHLCCSRENVKNLKKVTVRGSSSDQRSDQGTRQPSEALSDSPELLISHLFEESFSWAR